MKLKEAWPWAAAAIIGGALGYCQDTGPKPKKASLSAESVENQPVSDRVNNVIVSTSEASNPEEKSSQEYSVQVCELMGYVQTLTDVEINKDRYIEEIARAIERLGVQFPDGESRFIDHKTGVLDTNGLAGAVRNDDNFRNYSLISSWDAEFLKASGIGHKLKGAISAEAYKALELQWLFITDIHDFQASPSPTEGATCTPTDQVLGDYFQSSLDGIGTYNEVVKSVDLYYDEILNFFSHRASANDTETDYSEMVDVHQYMKKEGLLFPGDKRRYVLFWFRVLKDIGFAEAHPESYAAIEILEKYEYYQTHRLINDRPQSVD